MILALGLPGSSEGANKRLDRIKGSVGYAPAPDAPLHMIFGHGVIPDDVFAITKADSAAALVLPDSSIVSLGENTKVRVGAFTTGTDGPGSTIAVDGGTVRFDIRRPTGGAANYRFTTTTSNVAVRGTVGLISFIAGNTTVVCLACAADSVTISVGSQSIALVTGQLVTVSATGAVVSGAVTSTALSSFSSSQVSTSAATGPTGAVSGISGASSASISSAGSASAATAAGAASAGAAASAGIAGATSSVVGAAAGAVAVGVGVTTIVNKATPAPTPTPVPTPTPTQAGTGYVSGVGRSAAPAAAPAAAPTPAPPALPREAGPPAVRVR